MTKKQRIQRKGLICALAALLLLILLIGGLAAQLGQGNTQEKEPGETEEIPKIRELKNVWILGETPESLTVYADGKEQTYPRADGQTELRKAQIADLILTGGAVTQIFEKEETIHAAVQRIGEDFVDLAGYGKVALAKEYRGYRLYGEPEMMSAQDLVIGYDFADFVLDEGMICAILFARQETMDIIRVLLKSESPGGGGISHREIQVSCDGDFWVEETRGGSAQGRVQYRAGEVCILDSESFREKEEDCKYLIGPSALTGKLYINPSEQGAQRIGYRGELEIRRGEGGLVAVNVLPLEEYLYGVVPSEMPASYPMEALKAQAICARTYAYARMLHAGYPLYGAHLDDSTAYQVYNHQTEQEAATNAVKATFGQILYAPDGRVAETFYYSTSCGQGTDEEVWKARGVSDADYLTGKKISRDQTDQAAQEQNAGRSESFWWDDLLKEQGSILENMDLEMFLAADEGNREKGRQEEDLNLLGAEFLLTTDPADFEAGEAWYRWIYQVSEPDISRMRELLGENAGEEAAQFTRIEKMAVTARGAGGAAEELTIETDRGSYTVLGEYAIREVLCDGRAQALRADGKRSNCPKLLPSAFFILMTGNGKENVIGYTLIGGGFGHGVGMSQNGAKEMAREGWTAREILSFFYEGCQIK